MSSLHRSVDGDVQIHRLSSAEQTIDHALLAKNGRSARTLSKVGALRLTLIAVAPSGELPVHSADGPISVHVLEGDVVFNAAGVDHALAAGDVLVLAAGIDHSVRSEGGGSFLLTVVHTTAG
jgi:quercetin dioxygenase-like cupin family protein